MDFINLHYVAYFWGGAFLLNAIPHLVKGVTGEPFQSPFANPPGKGLSSSTVNALWGSFNVVVGYGLLLHVGVFDIRNLNHAAAAGSGALALALWISKYFGKFHGGNNPVTKKK